MFMSDVAAAAIMCSPKAVYSWDLVFKKFGKFVFVDRRDEENVMDFEETQYPFARKAQLRSHT